MNYSEMMFAIEILSKTPKCTVAIVCDKALHTTMMNSIKNKCGLTCVPHTNSLKHSCGSSVHFLHTSLAGCQGRSYHHVFVMHNGQLNQQTIDQIKTMKTVNTHNIEGNQTPDTKNHQF